MGRRKKTLDALEDLLYQLQENVLPMITLSDDKEATRKQVIKLRKLVEAERDDWNARQILKRKQKPEPEITSMAPVKFRWTQREVQTRDRTAEIPILQLITWCKAKGIDWSEDFGADDLEAMLDECGQTSKGWHLGYEEWKTTEHEFVDLHMAGRDD